MQILLNSQAALNEFNIEEAPALTAPPIGGGSEWALGKYRVRALEGNIDNEMNICESKCFITFILHNNTALKKM